MSNPVHEIGPWRFGDNPDLDVIRQECELARDRKLRVSLDPAQLIELLDMILFVEEPEAVSPNKHHSLDDCDRCDELDEEIDELQEENSSLSKETAELYRQVDQLLGTIDTKNAAIDSMIKMPCQKCGG